MCQREDANSILGHVHTFGTCKSRSTWQIVGVRSYTALACIHGHSALISAVAAWTPKPHSWPLCPLADHAASLHCALRVSPNFLSVRCSEANLRENPHSGTFHETWVPHHSESSVMVSSKNAPASQPWQQSRSATSYVSFQNDKGNS